jgi:hypothetical protein
MLGFDLRGKNARKQTKYKQQENYAHGRSSATVYSKDRFQS